MYEALTLSELKNWLAISSTNTDKDTYFNSLRIWVTNFVEAYTNKKLITREFTEYYDGERGRELLLKFYPIYSVGSLYDDVDHDYDSTTLIAAADYRIYYDYGQIKLTDDESSFNTGQENVKITYRSGLSRFLLVDEANNYIDIRESTSGTDYAVELTPPSTPHGTWPGYDAEGIASALQTALRADDDLTLQYVVAYNQATQRFTISTGTNFTIKWDTGASAAKDIGPLMGFVTSTDTAAGTSHASSSTDIETGIPEDLKMCMLQIADFMYNESAKGKGNLLQVRQAFPHGEGTLQYIKDIPANAKLILDLYSGAI